MSVLSLDLGGTKLAIAVFSDDINLLLKEKIALESRKGAEVGQLISSVLMEKMVSQQSKNDPVCAIGISVPGIFYKESGTVWAPNIEGWEAFPLFDVVSSVAGSIPIVIDNDRACYITGECTKGVARECTDAVFIAVGTGIGAGILADGRVLRGAMDISGSIGWMALDRPFSDVYRDSGCFESRCSGEGIARVAREKVKVNPEYNGILKVENEITSHKVFDAYEKEDPIAREVIFQSIELWGMALANVVSFFNPQMVIFGGGVFGPAKKFLVDIEKEAQKWGQPVSMKHVKVSASALEQDAGIYGAACLAIELLKSKSIR